MSQTIRTNDLLTADVWSDILKKYGGNKQYVSKHVVNQHAQKHFSQSGEDGMLDYLLQKIGAQSKVCVEFGAHDGVCISTTLLLRKKHNFRRILIEGCEHYKNLTNGEKIVKAVITPENINQLLEQEKCPDTFDVLSIDIDGDDYWVWKAIEKKPRILIIEYQCAIPNEQCLAIIPGSGDIKSHINYKGYSELNKRVAGLPLLNGYYGANLRAMYRLSIEKGYKFVTTLTDNAIFVLAEEFDKLGLPEISEDECIEKYFVPIQYWYDNRDIHNQEWMIIE